MRIYESLALGGNIGWIVAGIVLSFTIIPFANRSTLAMLIGRTPQHILVDAISPRKPAGYQLYLIGKEIANKKLLNEDGWNLLSLQEQDKGLLTIPPEHEEYAKTLKDEFPLIKVYYAEDKFDSLDRYILYHFTKQDIDQNIALGIWKLVLGYAGVGEDEKVILEDREFEVTKIYVFDIIPKLQNLVKEKPDLFPNAELLRQFTENILTFDTQYNRLEALKEKVGWYEEQNKRLNQTVIDIKETYGSDVANYRTLLGLHKKEIALEDIKITEMQEKRHLLPEFHLSSFTSRSLMFFVFGIIILVLLRIMGII